ncbi:MAG TPA: YtxH domain-containing protein [Candidatus Saccharimonadales bacterium]|nr:YtxH domain-containing protein [Candidatus Saccharimonadales bacterium]
MKKSTKRLATGTMLALAVGYVAGILTAPKSGKETRQDIKDTANKAINEAEKRLKTLHTELTVLLGQAKARADKLSGSAKTQMETAIKAAQVAKEKAREILSAVHEGDTDDKDLQKAINEANKAVDHLKTYLSK